VETLKKGTSIVETEVKIEAGKKVLKRLNKKKQNKGSFGG